MDHSVAAHTWHFFYRAQETWEAMYKDCTAACHSIELEQYLIENDGMGRQFMELFIEKARAGIKIFLVCDTFGSLFLYFSPLVKQLREAGGHVHFYNPLRGWIVLTPWRWFPRTHTKTLLIDSKVAYTGGVCIAERMRYWRDTHIRITGPVTAQIREAFDEVETRIAYRITQPLPTVLSWESFAYFLNRPERRQRAIYEEFKKAINAAQQYIYISSAYFVPNRRFVKLLKQAHQRGVAIHVLVPRRSDVRLADLICLSYTPRFLKAGLRIFHYQETVLHSKTAIIDDNWGTVGSSNFDILSFFYNREANLMIADKQAIADLKQQFFKDLAVSEELTWDGWHTVPRWKKYIAYSARASKAFIR